MMCNFQKARKNTKYLVSVQIIAYLCSVFGKSIVCNTSTRPNKYEPN